MLQGFSASAGSQVGSPIGGGAERCAKSVVESPRVLTVVQLIFILSVHDACMATSDGVRGMSAMQRRMLYDACAYTLPSRLMHSVLTYGRP